MSVLASVHKINNGVTDLAKGARAAQSLVEISQVMP